MQSDRINSAILRFFETLQQPADIAKIEPVKTLDEIRQGSMLFLPLSDAPTPKHSFRVVGVREVRRSGDDVQIDGNFHEGCCNPYLPKSDFPVWYTTDQLGKEQDGFILTQSQVDQGQIYKIQ